MNSMYTRKYIKNTCYQPVRLKLNQYFSIHKKYHPTFITKKVQAKTKQIKIQIQKISVNEKQFVSTGCWHKNGYIHFCQYFFLFRCFADQKQQLAHIAVRSFRGTRSWLQGGKN